jgi:hypothetical protein
MENLKQSEVDEHRAVVLTGLSKNDLRSLAHQARLGHEAGGEEMVFTYDELRKLCVMAAASHL